MELLRCTRQSGVALLPQELDIALAALHAAGDADQMLQLASLHIADLQHCSTLVLHAVAEAAAAGEGMCLLTCGEALHGRGESIASALHASLLEAAFEHGYSELARAWANDFCLHRLDQPNARVSVATAVAAMKCMAASMAKPPWRFVLSAAASQGWHLTCEHGCQLGDVVAALRPDTAPAMVALAWDLPAQAPFALALYSAVSTRLVQTRHFDALARVVEKGLAEAISADPEQLAHTVAALLTADQLDLAASCLRVAGSQRRVLPRGVLHDVLSALQARVRASLGPAALAHRGRRAGAEIDESRAVAQDTSSAAAGTSAGASAAGAAGPASGTGYKSEEGTGARGDMDDPLRRAAQALDSLAAIAHELQLLMEASAQPRAPAPGPQPQEQLCIVGGTLSMLLAAAQHLQCVDVARKLVKQAEVLPASNIPPQLAVEAARHCALMCDSAGLGRWMMRYKRARAGTCEGGASAAPLGGQHWQALRRILHACLATPLPMQAQLALLVESLADPPPPPQAAAGSPAGAVRDVIARLSVSTAAATAVLSQAKRREQGAVLTQSERARLAVLAPSAPHAIHNTWPCARIAAAAIVAAQAHPLAGGSGGDGGAASAASAPAATATSAANGVVARQSMALPAVLAHVHAIVQTSDPGDAAAAVAAALWAQLPLPRSVLHAVEGRLAVAQPAGKQQRTVQQ